MHVFHAGSASSVAVSLMSDMANKLANKRCLEGNVGGRSFLLADTPSPQ